MEECPPGDHLSSGPPLLLQRFVYASSRISSTRHDSSLWPLSSTPSPLFCVATAPRYDFFLCRYTSQNFPCRSSFHRAPCQLHLRSFFLFSLFGSLIFHLPYHRSSAPFCSFLQASRGLSGTTQFQLAWWCSLKSVIVDHPHPNFALRSSFPSRQCMRRRHIPSTCQ